MYGVVTNTMYHEYMYAARAALGASAGLPMEVLLGQYGIMLATTSYTITFKRYARPPSRAVVAVTEAAVTVYVRCLL
jgi:acyl-CoA thioesterase FadM